MSHADLQLAGESPREAIRIGPALVAVFIARAVGGAVISLFISVLPFYNHSYAYNSWDRYVVGFSVAACVVGAFFMPLVMRMFRYQISVGAAFIALFLGVIAANVVFAILVSASGNGSPYWSLPFSATFGPIGGLVSLLVSAWLVCELAGRRQRKLPEAGSFVGPT